ncbi:MULTISPECIES: structural cement protein Gp24 [Gammaproteobacteria]|uniref:structural cement protein Gp24 n=1 Tax=Gammaproteobacteria TaxID=1236 RepID=UPI002FC6EE4A
MSLIKASFTVHRAKAYAGMIADTSLYNIDGVCAAGVDKLKTGLIVALDPSGDTLDGYKVVTNVINTANPNIVGVTVMSHSYSPDGTYELGCATNVMTNGRAWVLCEKSFPAAGYAFNKQVKITNAGVVSNSGAIGTVYTTTGEWLKTDHPDYDIIKIQVTQAQFQLPATP